MNLDYTVDRILTTCEIDYVADGLKICVTISRFISLLMHADDQSTTTTKSRPIFCVSRPGIMYVFLHNVQTTSFMSLC